MIYISYNHQQQKSQHSAIITLISRGEQMRVCEDLQELANAKDKELKPCLTLSTWIVDELAKVTGLGEAQLMNYVLDQCQIPRMRLRLFGYHY